MVRRLVLLFLLLAPLVLADETKLEDARKRVRALETDIQELIDRVSPAVGAVTNYTARFDIKTGKVSMAPRSLGSGTVVDPRGFFLTNVHVIEGAGYLTVALNDGRRYPATLYADTSKGQVKGDIALLKLRGKKRFPFVRWTDGDAKKLEPGSFVFAMGNPHGHALDGTPVVTMGIISGKGRAAAEAGYLYVDSVQTDAEINPGNSGGPLFDIKGRFVGINGLMSSRQGRSNSGVGFAIPVNQIRLFMRKLLKVEGGGVAYGFHGLTVKTDRDGGAIVSDVVNGSPAQKAGIRRGDVVSKVKGKRVNNRTEFVNIVAQLPEGASVSISFRRGRSSKTVRVKLANYQEFLASAGRVPRAGPRPIHERGYLGVEWKAVGSDIIEITSIQTGSGAADTRLEVGDQIVEVDGRGVATPKALVDVLASREPDEKIKLTVLHGKKKRTLRLVLCDAAMQAGLGN